MLRNGTQCLGLGQIRGLKKEEGSNGRMGKLRNECLRELCTSSSIIRVTRSSKMRGACGTYGLEETACIAFGVEY
jgi:hypothetical protein